MARNANGEGCIYKRMRDGRVARYEGVLSYAAPDGAIKRHTVYAKTRAECRDKMRKARERIDGGAPARDAAMRLADWLAHWRKTTLAASDRKASTKALYDNVSRRHLEPDPFGAIRLNRLAPSDIEGLVLAMRAQTKPAREGDDEPQRRALSDSTIRQTYTVLRTALDGAVRDGLLARNPATVVKRPGVARREAEHLDTGAVVAVLKAAESSRYHAALVLIAATGLRRGEALALRWDRVDLDAGVLRVAATIGRVGGQLVVSEPKTARSRRPVPLPRPSLRCSVSTRQRKPLSARPPGPNGETARGSCSPRTAAGQSTRAICCAWSRSQRKPPGSRASACTRSGTARRWRGLSAAYISRPSPICSDIRRSRSPATCTAILPTTRPALQSRA